MYLNVFIHLRLEWSKEVLDLCVEFKNDGVVAIDIAGDEQLANPTHELHVRAFEVSSATNPVMDATCLLRHEIKWYFWCCA